MVGTMPAVVGASPLPVPPAVEVAFPSVPPHQRRWTVLLRLILLIPQAVAVFALSVGALVVGIIGWFGALFTGRLPVFAVDFLTGWLRWITRFYAYAFLLVDRYPPFTLDRDAAYPVWLEVEAFPLNRAAVFFRLILV